MAIRGVSGGGTTGFYIDDTPVPDSMDPQVVDILRIEVLKGPQGTLFGAGSMGGNVRIVTQQPQFDTSGQVTASAGYTDRGTTPDGRVTGSANFMLFNDSVAVRTVLFSAHDSGFITREFPVSPGSVQMSSEGGQGAQSKIGGSVSALMHLGANGSITVRLMGQNIDAHGAAENYAPLPGFSPLGYIFDRQANLQEGWTDGWYLPSVELHFDVGDWKLTSSTSYFWRRSYDLEDSTEGSIQAFGLYGYSPPSSLLGAGVPWYLLLTDERFNQEWRASWSGSSPLKASLGARYAHERLDSYLPPISNQGLVSDGIWPTSLLFVGDTGESSFDSSVFGELYYTFSRFELTLGARGFWLEQKTEIIQNGFFNGGFVSTPNLESTEHGAVPKVALSYTAPDEALIYGSASKGFRAGGPNEFYPPICDSGIAQLGLTSDELKQFKSDSLWNYEVGAKDKVGPLTVSGALFQMNWSDIQQRIILPVCEAPATVNAGKARIRGAELEATGRVAESLEYRIGVGYQDPKILSPGLSGLPSGSRIPQVPYLTGTVAVRYTHALTASTNVYFSTDYSYVGSSLSSTSTQQFSLAPAERAGYGLWNAGMGGDWGPNRLEFYTKNILNKEANLGDIYPVGFTPVDAQGLPLPRVAVLRPFQAGVEFSRKF